MSIGTRALTSAKARLAEAERMYKQSRGDQRTRDGKRRRVEICRYTLSAVMEKLEREEEKA